MRDLRALNLVCNHRNLRLFDAQRLIISHQRLGLFVRVWRAYGKRMHVAQAHVRGIFMFIILVPSYVASMYLYVTNVIVYYQYITVCLYILVCYTYILVCYSYALVLVCYSYVTRML